MQVQHACQGDARSFPRSVLAVAAAVLAAVAIASVQVVFPATALADADAALGEISVSEDGQDTSLDTLENGCGDVDGEVVIERIGSDGTFVDVDAAVEVLASSSYTDEEYSLVGFVAWMLGDDDHDLSDEAILDLEYALEQIEICEYYGYMDCSDDDDATNLDNVAKSLSIMSKIDDLRASDDNFEDYGEVYTDFFLMVSSAYTANISSTAYAHVSTFSSFANNEGLAWGYSDPTVGWYTEEKEIFDAYRDELGYSGYLTDSQVEAIEDAAADDGETVGHYTGLFYSEDQAMGVGWCTYKNDYGNRTASYNCTTASRYEDNGLELYTVDEMEELLGDYIDYLESGDYDEVSRIDGTRFISLDGATRYETMQAIVEEAYDGESSEYAVLATGDNFPDALASASLAGVLDAPIVLVSSDDPSAAIEELQELDTSYAYVVGGGSAISSSAMGEITDATGIGYERVYGEGRQETALAIASKVEKISLASGSGSFSDTAIVVSCANFPDALSASSFAYCTSSPIYLAEADGSVSEDVLDAIGEGGYSRVLVLGGDAVVSDDAIDSIVALGDMTVWRIYGADRYLTSTAMATWCVAYADMTYDGCAVATGVNFPDALAGASLCGRTGSVMLLSEGSNVAAIDYLEEYASSVGTVYYLGGTGAVSRLTRNMVQSVFR